MCLHQLVFYASMIKLCELVNNRFVYVGDAAMLIICMAEILKERMDEI